MTVILRMQDGSKYRLDRNLSQFHVAHRINSARVNPASPKLIEFETDATPTGQKIWVDPALVAAIEDERHGF